MTRRLYSWYLMCFGTGGALWLCSLAVSGPPRYAVWTAALAADAVGGLGMLAPSRYVPLNPGHLTERFQLFVLIVLGESVARLISAATLRPWSVPLAAVLTAAVVTLATMWWAWIRSADQRALDRPPAIARFAAVNLPIVAGIAAASAGLHIAVLAADGATAIAIGPRAALYGGVSVGLLATAIMPSGKMTKLSRAARLATSVAAMGLVFMGAIVLPAYLVPALTVVLALGLAAESRLALKAGAHLGASTPFYGGGWAIDRHRARWRSGPGRAARRGGAEAGAGGGSRRPGSWRPGPGPAGGGAAGGGAAGGGAGVGLAPGPGAGAAAGGSAGVLGARGDAADREDQQALVGAGLLGGLVRAQRAHDGVVGDGGSWRASSARLRTPSLR